MEHVKTLGDVIYLDVEDCDILNRLAEMKVNRIVGQNEGKFNLKNVKHLKKIAYQKY